MFDRCWVLECRDDWGLFSWQLSVISLSGREIVVISMSCRHSRPVAPVHAILSHVFPLITLQYMAAMNGILHTDRMNNDSHGLEGIIVLVGPLPSSFWTCAA